MPPDDPTGCLPERVRVSLGSAIAIGLLYGKLDADPTTAYLMTHTREKCTANCGFCPQARESKSSEEMLSRVTWPVFNTATVIDTLGKAFNSNRIRRVCVQALNYREVFGHLESLIRTIDQKAKVPISVSCQPINVENIRLLAEAGADRIGIPLDAATEALFNMVKGPFAGGPYNWKNQLETLREAVNVFGKNKVSTHFIVGLGEKEEEMVEVIQRCVDAGIVPSLFAFTPVKGTALEKLGQPPISGYRRLQLARHLIVHGTARYERMQFDGDGSITDLGLEKATLGEITETGEPFRTSGCPNCNRPYYNERPCGPIYNYPREPTQTEIREIQKELHLVEA